MTYQRQLALEAEGAAAFFAGTAREACPHPADSFEWNHWVYGWDCAASEKDVVQAGGGMVCSTASWDDGQWMTLADMERLGIFKPRYFTKDKWSQSQQ